MESESDEGLTQLLQRARDGDREAREAVIPILEQRLRHRAERALAAGPPDPLIQPTSLIDQVLVDLVVKGQHPWPSRRDFDRLAAKVMRDVITSHVRRERARKRDGGGVRIAVEELNNEPAPDRGTCGFALADALERLEAMDPELSAIVELRFFGDKTFAEIAEALGVSKATVERRWRVARTWLQDWIATHDDGRSRT